MILHNFSFLFLNWQQVVNVSHDSQYDAKRKLKYHCIRLHRMIKQDIYTDKDNLHGQWAVAHSSPEHDTPVWIQARGCLGEAQLSRVPVTYGHEYLSHMGKLLTSTYQVWRRFLSILSCIYQLINHIYSHRYHF